MARVVVIGAGVGGLASAARLAALGHGVTLCEGSSHVGGKLGTYAYAGFRFDTGPSLLTLPHVLADAFAATGDPLESMLELKPAEPIFHRFADGTTSTMDRLLDRQAWRGLFDTAEAAWPTVFERVLSAPRAPLRQLATGATTKMPALRLTPWRSLSTVARRRFADPRLWALLERYATYAGADPRRASGMLALIPYLEKAYGIWHVAGGLQRIAEALATRCVELGVELRLGTRVTGIESSGRRATAVKLHSGRLPADIVVSNAAEGLRGERAGRRPSLSGFVLLLGLRGRTPGLQHHTVLFPEHYHAEFDAIFARRPRPPDDPTLYVCAPDDPAMRPEGHEGWFVLANAPAHGTGDHHFDWTTPGVATEYAARITRLLAARGYDATGRVLFSHIRTPADLERDTATPGGAIYGSAARGPWADLLKRPNRTRLSNVYLVGGSVHPGGGLPLVLLSAAIVAGLIGPA